MANFITRLFSRKKNLESQRLFKAASPSRLTDGWTMMPQPVNYTVRAALRQLVARSRESWENNPYVKRFVDVLTSNVIGHLGIQPFPMIQSSLKPNTLDDEVNLLVQSRFNDWAEHSADIAERITFTEMQRLALKTLAIDGEVFIRLYRNAALPQGFALQFIDGQYVDLMFEKTLPNGNYIMQGIEYDSQNREIAFHVYQPKDQSSYSSYAPQGVGEHLRIPASEMLHIFIPFRVDQRRGIPMTANALEQLKILDGYIEAGLVAARVGAANCGFFSTIGGEEQTIADNQSLNGSLSFDAEPGTFRQLPNGVKLEQFKADYPNTSFQPFVKTLLRQIASGLGISYTSLANDIESVNYSSIRQDALTDREMYRVLTNALVAQFVRPVYDAWLKVQLLSGTLQLATKTNPKTFNPKHYQQFKAVRFAGRPFPSIDPQKDANSHALEIANGIRSRSDLIRTEMGREPDQVWQEIASENAKLAKLGLNFGQNITSDKEMLDIRENL